MTSEKEIIQFLEEQTKLIKPLLEKINYSYWDATTTGNGESYRNYELYQKELAKLLNNTEVFKKIKGFLDLNPEDRIIKRQLIVLYNIYLGNQGDLDLINKILEKSTLIEQKFNLFRAKIGENEFTDNQIKDILKTEIDSRKLQEAWEASKTQGEAVAKDLIELVKLRNELARSLGFKNYYIFSLETNEQKNEEVSSVFDEVENSTLQTFKEVKKEIDDFLSKKYNTNELKPWHYNDLFFQEAPKIQHVDLDKFYREGLLEKAENFYSGIGIDVLDILEKSDLYEKPGKYQHAYCIDLDREGDIRTLMNIKNNLYWAATILHEFGHAVYDKYINGNLPYLIRDKSHILTTEAIALLFERNARNISFIHEFCNVDMDEISRIKEDVKNELKLSELIFARWSLVMLHFERSLYENPDQDLNKLWWELVKKYQLIGFSRDKADWASKIHFVSAPVYYHNYLLGKLFASQINHYISRNILNQDSVENLKYSGEKKIGNYLKEKIFFPGAYYKWNELIEYSTGEPLNPKYWIKEFCK